MKKSLKWLVAALILVAAALAIAVTINSVKHPGAVQAQKEAGSAPSSASEHNGLAAVSLDLQTQKREDIRVARLRQISMRTELSAVAVVLSVSDLATTRNSYVAAARTQLERDQAHLSVLRSQYQRVKQLYEENQNMSLKAMQDAETAYRDSEAQLATDKQNAGLQLDVVRQTWGNVVTDWIARNAPILESILQQRDFLMQVVFPPGQVATPPGTLSLHLPNGHIVAARFVSSFPQVNPQIQGINFLYLVSARPGLAVGMNLAVSVPVGPLLRGTVIPEDAVVWSQGTAWVYVQTSPHTFTRRMVPTSNPLPSGYFVSGNAFAPDAKIVISGAQALLSQEMILSGQGGAGEDTD